MGELWWFFGGGGELGEKGLWPGVGSAWVGVGRCYLGVGADTCPSYADGPSLG